MFIQHILFVLISWLTIVSSYPKEDPGYFLLKDNTTPISLDHKLFRGFPTENKGCNDNTSLLIGVISTPSEFNVRSKIRRKFLDKMDKTKMIFLLGSTKSPNDDFDVMMEEQKHGDIAKLNILENYRNLTLKTYGLISYADKYCKNVKCVVKMDTDVEVNVEELEELCRSLPDNEQMITGQLFENAEVVRDISSKWYVPHYVYSNKVYPNFTNGPIYVLSGYGILPQMLKAVQEKTPFFNSENYRRLSEDVIFTGIVREKTGIKIQDYKALHSGSTKIPSLFFETDDFRTSSFRATQTPKTPTQTQKTPTQPPTNGQSKRLNLQENYRRLSEDVIFTGIVREKAGIKIQDYKALHSGSTKFPSFFFGRDDFGTGSFRAHTRRPK